MLHKLARVLVVSEVNGWSLVVVNRFCRKLCTDVWQVLKTKNGVLQDYSSIGRDYSRADLRKASADC